MISKCASPASSNLRKSTVRVFCLPLALALAAVMGGDSAKAMEVSCPSSPVTSEGSSTDKDQLELLVRQATACVREKKPMRAVALLTEVIRRAPTNAGAYLNRGSAEASAGEVTLAIGDYTTALHLQHDLVEAWYNRGTTYTHLRRYENAIADSPRRSGLSQILRSRIAIGEWPIFSSAAWTTLLPTTQSRSTKTPSSPIVISIVATSI
jgi:Tetratricopeptide repeat